MDYGVDRQPGRRRTTIATCTDVIHRLCMREIRSQFDRAFSTVISTGRIDVPVENGCGKPRDKRVFPNCRTGAVDYPQADQITHGIPSRRISAGYHSPVCSNTGDEIERIAAAIDQLASDAKGGEGVLSEHELALRIASLWQMVSDLDPELARRARGYTTPADGGPSA